MRKLLAFCSALLLCLHADAAFFYTVTGMTDNTNSTPLSGSGTAGSPFLMSSLRGATIAANSNPGSTITLLAGTYSLTIPGDVNDRQFVSFNPLIGDLNVNSSGTTIKGAGPASTFIQQTTGNDRIIVANATSAANFTFTLSGVTITGGRETEAGHNIGGAAIFVGGPTNVSVFTNCIFVNNRINPSVGSLGGGALINTGGDCIVVDCTFGGTNATDPNISITSGGAISYDSSDFIHNSLIGTLTVSNCTFINNVATNHGGAITIADSNLSSATANISHCTFIGNKAGSLGGAIVAQSGTLNVSQCTFLTNFAQNAGGAIAGSGIPNTVHYCRFIANTAGTPTSGNTLTAQTASLNANDNWWGVNTTNVNDSFNAIVTSWLQLRHVANPSQIFIPNSSTFTATFLTNSAGTFIPVSNLSQLLGLPITFNNALRGTLSGAQTTIQPSGTATATFTATVAGTGGANAVVDNQATSVFIVIPTGVSSINRVQVTTNNLASVQWSVTFTNAVTNVTAGNFSFANVGLGGAPAVIGISPAVGILTNQWIVTASTGSGFGTLGLNMANATGVSAVIVNVPFTGQVYTIDLVPPDTSITAQPAAITNVTSATFGFNATDVGVGVTNLQCRLDGGTFTNCTSPVSFSGLADASHTFDVRAVDGVGNVEPTPASVTWIVDTIPPSVSIGPPSLAYTRTGIVTYAVTYGDLHFNASTLTAGSVTLNKTGSANGSVLVTGSGTTRTVTLTNTTGDGTLGISLAAGTASDTASNTAPAAGPSATFTVDNTPPTINIGAPSTTFTRTGIVNYVVTYTDVNFNASTLAASNVTLITTGTATGTVLVTGSGTTRTVTITNTTGDGTLGISIAAGTASDNAGNTAPAAGPSATFTVDNTPPTINIGAPSTTLTRTGVVNYVVTYADTNFNTSTLAPGNVTLNRTGSANGSVLISGSGTNRTVTITNITGDGTIGISIAAGTASDNAGNTAPAAGPSATFSVDNTPPTINIGAPSTTLTRTGIVSYLVTYGGTNFNASTLSPGDVTLNKTGTANGTVLVSGSGTNRTVTITNTTGDGTISISIVAGTASDTAGNTAPAAGPSATFTVDNTPPSITCPADVTVSANLGTCSATNVALGLPVASDASGVVGLTNNALTIYPIGTNTVTWSVRDNVGLSNSCKQLVIVRDTQPPTVFCPSDITTNSAKNCPIIVTFSASATDNCGLSNLVVTPGTGSAFPVGTNIVNLVAWDFAGNTNTCSFRVIVTGSTNKPVLTIAQSGANAVISWTNSYPCFGLQYAATLAGTNNWTNYPGLISVVGNRLYATNALGPPRFFRLAN